MDATEVISNVTFPKNEFVKRAVLTRDVWAYETDPNLCIEIDYHDAAFLHLARYEAPWLNNFPQPGPFQGGFENFSSHYYRVSYGSSVIENVVLVTIDGGPDATGGYRCQLPLPESGTTVSRWRYGVARIVNDSESNLDYAMKTAGFGVAGA